MQAESMAQKVVEVSRDVPYDPDEICDICGKKGAFDFMGDLICLDCLQKDKETDDDDEE